jgi:hypothetical protein
MFRAVRERIALTLPEPDERLRSAIHRSPSRIPRELLPQKIKDWLIVDVMLLSGKLTTHIRIDPAGVIIGRESGGSPALKIHSSDIYAVRVRSGVWGRIGLTRWRCIF